VEGHIGSRLFRCLLSKEASSIPLRPAGGFEVPVSLVGQIAIGTR
jgi:hypothetical protein